VQVQRAGGEGFSHNEVNPDADWNRMIQFWVLPEQPGQPSDYKTYQPVIGELTRIYVGEVDQKADFPAKTKIDVAILEGGQDVEVNESFLAYLTRGKGVANGETIEDGELLKVWNWAAYWVRTQHTVGSTAVLCPLIEEAELTLILSRVC